MSDSRARFLSRLRKPWVPPTAILLAVLLAVVLTSGGGFSPSRVASDEKIVFFPTAAHLTPDGKSWVVPVHGWIFEPEEDDRLRGATIDALQKTLGLDAEGENTEIFRRRMALFLVDNERHKQIVIRLGHDAHPLPESAANGHFRAALEVRASKLPAAAGSRLRFAVSLPETDTRRFEGEVHLVGPRGISVISDIDDTVKISEVTDKHELLANTFYRPFRAAPGMARLYQQWARAGAAFHFVSSSPWQLYTPISAFLRREGFPDASFHLKNFRLKDTSALDLLADPTETKPRAIEPILSAYPERHFVLVGDSGEMDPEVYGELARKHPKQVLRIFIRNVTEQPPTAPRFAKAFKDLPADKWQVFTDPTGLKLPSP